jgi:hypothetical protein
MQIDQLQPQFVEEIPSELQPGVLYISMEFATAQHLCPCGCGSKIVTPLHPTRWRLTYDGEGVSLHPSVGSGGLPCRSHYFIRDNRVQWVRWSGKEAQRAQWRDRIDTEAFFTGRQADAVNGKPDRSGAPDQGSIARRIWRRAMRR